MRELTQEQVAESCNVSISTVSRWESNRSTPIRKHRILLAATLQTHNLVMEFFHLFCKSGVDYYDLIALYSTFSHVIIKTYKSFRLL